MDIGTAKPKSDMFEIVPHYLFDIVDPDEDFSVYDFSQIAKSTIDKINLKGRVPILVGGTGQYIWSLLENWEHEKGTFDVAMRKDLERRLQSEGLESLVTELTIKDPETASLIDIKNSRRVIRAIEKIALGHEGYTPRKKNNFLRDDCLLIGITCPRDDLYAKVDERVDVMFEEGWIEEIETLNRNGYDTNLSAMSSIGYQEISFLLRSEITIEECKTRIYSRTHKLIRSQYNWFKMDDPRINWFDISFFSEEDIIDEIIELYDQI
jgi:tRNA dimethylallyltransferase